MFKPGDKVKRVGPNFSHVIRGSIYTIKSVHSNAAAASLELMEIPGGYSDKHFILIEEEAPTFFGTITYPSEEKLRKQPKMTLVQEFVTGIEPKELADRAWEATELLCKGN